MNTDEEKKDELTFFKLPEGKDVKIRLLDTPNLHWISPMSEEFRKRFECIKDICPICASDKPSGPLGQIAEQFGRQTRMVRMNILKARGAQKHKKRRWMSETYHKRIQKKWDKRFKDAQPFQITWPRRTGKASFFADVQMLDMSTKLTDKILDKLKNKSSPLGFRRTLPLRRKK